MHLIVRMVLFIFALCFKMQQKNHLIQVDLYHFEYTPKQMATILFYFLFAVELIDDRDGDSCDSKTGFRVIQNLHANNNSLCNASYGVI